MTAANKATVLDSKWQQAGHFSQVNEEKAANVFHVSHLQHQSIDTNS